MKGPPGDGTYRIDLNGMPWISEWEVALEAAPLPLSSRLSSDFQILVEDGGVHP